MAWRAPHGNAKDHGQPGPRIEVLPPDELPRPVTDPVSVAEQEAAQAMPRDRGRLMPGHASALARLGGKSRGGRPSLVSGLGLTTGVAPDAAAFTPYRKKAASFRKAHCASLAALAGGECGTGPSSLVATAALQLAVSRYLYDQGASLEGKASIDFFKEARQQGDSSRQNLLAAYELAVREAQRRGKKDVDPLDVIEAKQRAHAKESQLANPHDGLG